MAYNKEVTHLRDYLKEGVDPWDYSWEVENFLNDNGADVGDDFDGLSWLEENVVKSPKIIQDFKEWLENSNITSDFIEEAPAYEAMSYDRFIKPQWLIHFTDDPHSISRKGFLYGHDGFDGLSHTVFKRERQMGSGYNFAFDLDSRYVRNGKKYGEHCVVFWGTGIEVTHYGDEEQQVIIWGPSVSKDMIFPIYYSSYSGRWEVRDERDDERILFEADDVSDAAHWITSNYRMLQNIRRKAKSKKRLLIASNEDEYEENEEEEGYEGKEYDENLPRHGDCFKAAGKLMMDGRFSGIEGWRDFVLVHADVTPLMGPMAGVKYSHAWIETADEILDYSMGKTLRMPKEVYYALGRPENITKYNHKQFSEKIDKYQHWGPWE